MQVPGRAMCHPLNKDCPKCEHCRETCVHVCNQAAPHMGKLLKWCLGFHWMVLMHLRKAPLDIPRENAIDDYYFEKCIIV